MELAVLDSTVLVSAFLTVGGVASSIIRQARERAFSCILSDEILAETQRVLLETPRLRQRYTYTDDDVQEFIGSLRAAALVSTDVPPLSGIVRDPNDDMIVACAVAAAAKYVVTRDDDLLALQTYGAVTMITPEAFMGVLRDRENREAEKPLPPPEQVDSGQDE